MPVSSANNPPPRLGAAYAQDSVLRFLDARTKVGVTMMTAILTLVCSGFMSQLVLFAATLIYALLLRRMKLLILLYAAMAVMMSIAALCGWFMGQMIPAMGGLSVRGLVIPFMRGLSMMNVVIALAMTTRVEDLLTTLERVRLPFCIFLPAAVMMRFIPIFTNDIRQVWETLRIKGWPVGPVFITVHPVIACRLLFAPVLFRALKSSETLGVASELKGLGTGERTILQDGKTLTSLDARVLTVLIFVTAACILCEVYLHDLLFVGPGRVH